MSTSLEALLAADISDATDFPPQHDAPGLRSLDLALRCTICGEFFDAPVTLACGHGFCSLCVRDALREKPECPSCRAAAADGHLRKNVVMEEAVVAWKSARTLILRLSRDEVEAKANGNETRLVKSRSMKEDRARKKRKRGGEVPDGRPTPPNKLAGPSGIQKPKNATHYCGILKETARSRYFPEDEEEEEEEEEEPNSNPDQVPTSDAEEEEEMQDNSLIECPVCGKKIRLDKINQHLDKGCPPPSPVADAGSRSSVVRKAKNKQDWAMLLKVGNGSSIKGKEKEKEGSRSRDADEEPERLPKVTYAVMKEKQLRELLQGHKLLTTGDKATLAARHQRYVMIYNANLDQSPQLRRTESDLRLDLQRWEEGKTFKKAVIADTAAYQKANKANFDGLVAAVRKKKIRDTKQGDGTSLPISTGEDPNAVIQSVARSSRINSDEPIVLDSEDEL